MPVGKCNRCRAVPRLHLARVEFVEGPFLFRHGFMLLPSFRDHHHDGFLQRAACHQQEFQYVVERSRVRAVGLNDREQLVQVFIEQIRFNRAFPRTHPVNIATQRVDFAIVRHESIGLSAIPTGKSVGRKPRVHHRQVSCVVLVA